MNLLELQVLAAVSRIAEGDSLPTVATTRAPRMDATRKPAGAATDSSSVTTSTTS